MRIVIITVLLICATPVLAEPTNDQRQIMCLAVTLFGEVRGEPDVDKYAAALVIMNRVRHKRFPNTVCAVVSSRAQFESMSIASPWRKYLNKAINGTPIMPQSTTPGVSQQLYNIAENAYYSRLSDLTFGATHFWSPTLQLAMGRTPPRWTVKYEHTAQFGNHHYHRM